MMKLKVLALAMVVTFTSVFTGVNVSASVKIGKQADIVYQDLAVAKKAKAYVQSVTIGGGKNSQKYADTYIGKNLDKQASIGDAIVNNDIAMSIPSASMNSFVTALVNSPSKFLISNGIDEYVCLAGSFINALPYVDSAEYVRKSLLNDKPTSYVLTVLELGFDKKTKTYYVRSIRDKELKSAKVINASIPKGVATRYIALTRLVVQPRVKSAEEIEAIKKGIVIKTIEQAKADKEYLKNMDFGGGKNDYYRKTYVGGFPYDDKRVGMTIKGDNGVVGMGDFDYGNSIIEPLFQNSLMGMISNGDNTMNIPCFSMYGKPDEFDINPDDNAKLVSGNKYTFIINIAEIGYDNMKNKFYFRNCETKVLESASMVKVGKLPNTIFKKIAFLRLVVEPIKPR